MRFTAILKNLYCKLFPPTIKIEGECQQCGKCCNNLILTYNKNIVRSEEDFLKLAGSDPRYSRFRLRAFNDDGDMIFTCSLLGEDGRCMDYANRLDICWQYPDTKMFLMGGKLLSGCGYSIIDSRRDERKNSFADYLRKVQRKKKNRSWYG